MLHAFLNEYVSVFFDKKITVGVCARASVIFNPKIKPYQQAFLTEFYSYQQVLWKLKSYIS